MKAIQHLFIAIALTALIMFPGFTRSAESRSESGNTRASVESVRLIDGERTYMKVLILDEWYIFIFEGGELIDVVPD
jgi:hypothetical protein